MFYACPPSVNTPLRQSLLEDTLSASEHLQHRTNIGMPQNRT